MFRTTPLLASFAVLGLMPASAAVLFEDSFNRANSRNTDGSTTGIGGLVGSTLAADSVYVHPWLDPNNEPGPVDSDPANGGGASISGGQLLLAEGAGTSNAYINHNFTDAAILADGGMTISIDVTGYAGSARQNGGGFAIGMSAAEAASAGDAFNINSPSMTGAYPDNPYGVTGNPVAPAEPDPNANYIVSDFWIGIRGNRSLAWGSSSGNVLGIGLNGLPVKTGTIAVSFFFSDFNAGSTVDYEVFYDGDSQGTGSFQWSGTNENYIGLDGRDGTAVTFDNLSIATVPEPGIALLGGLGLLGLLRRRR